MKNFKTLAIIAPLIALSVHAETSTEISIKGGNEDGRDTSGLSVTRYENGRFHRGSYDHVSDDDFSAEIASGLNVDGDLGRFSNFEAYGYVNYEKDRIDFARIDNISAGVGYQMATDIDKDVYLTHGARFGISAGDTCGVDTEVFGILNKKLAQNFKAYGKAGFNYRGGDGGCAEFKKATIEAGLVVEFNDRFYLKASVAMEASDLNDYTIYEERHEFLGFHTGSTYYEVERDVSSDFEPRYDLELGFRF